MLRIKLLLIKQKMLDIAKKFQAKDNPVSDEQRKKMLENTNQERETECILLKSWYFIRYKEKSFKTRHQRLFEKVRKPTVSAEPVYEDLYDLDYYQPRMNESNAPTREVQIFIIQSNQPKGQCQIATVMMTVIYPFLLPNRLLIVLANHCHWLKNA